MQHRNTDKRYSNSQNSLVFNFELLNLPWKFHNKNKGGGSLIVTADLLAFAANPNFKETLPFELRENALKIH